MNLKSEDDISSWGDSLEDFKPEYTAIKVRSLLQFFILEGRKTVLIKENLIPIPDLHYAVHSSYQNRYYFRRYRGYDIDTLYLYRKSLTFSGESTEVENLQRYVYDGNVHILLTNEQTENTRSMLRRLWKSHFVVAGAVPYKLYLNLLDQSLRLEDYRENLQGAEGYRTTCHQFEERIRAIWDEIYKTKD